MTASPEKCGLVTCKEQAKYIVRLNVPAIGYPKNKPIAGLLIGIKLCAKCVDDVDVTDFVNEDVKTAINLATRHFGGIKADFKNAYAVPVEINSDEYRDFVDMQGNTHRRGR